MAAYQTSPTSWSRAQRGRTIVIALLLAALGVSIGVRPARAQDQPQPAASQPGKGAASVELFVRAVRKRLESGRLTPPVLQIQVRYRNPAAAEVTLIWGLNKFAPAPANLPPGTELTYNGSHMNTPMKREGDLFVFDYEVADNTRFDYAFRITKSSAGETVDLWRGDPTSKTAYYTTTLSMANADEVIDESKSKGWPLHWYVMLGLSFGLSAFFALALMMHVLRLPKAGASAVQSPAGAPAPSERPS